jgi:hypothetical protein
VPALHLHDDAMQGAVADLRERLQQLGDLQQERIAIVGGKRRRGGEDRHHLTVGQSKRRHATEYDPHCAAHVLGAEVACPKQLWAGAAFRD